MTLAGNNTFSGGAFLNNGSVVAASSTVSTPTGITSGPLGTGSIRLGANGGSLAASLLLDNTPGRTLANPITVSSGNNQNNQTVGALNTSGVVTYSGDITMGTGSSGDFGHNMVLAATNGGEVDFTGNILANLGSGHSVVFANSLSGTGNAVVKLTGNNTFAGGLQISSFVTVAAGLTSGSNRTLGVGKVTLGGGTLALQGQQTSGAQQTVDASGYNQSLIVPVGAASATAATSTTIDGSNVLYQQGYVSTAGFSGAHGVNASGTYVSQFNPAVTFQLQQYTGNTALQVPNNNGGSATLTLTNPGAFKTVNLLSDTGNTSPTVQVTFNFDDTTTETKTITVSNWFYNGSGPRLAVGGNNPTFDIGSITRSNDTFSDFPAAMYEDDLTLSPTDQSKQLDSITFTMLNNQGGSHGVNIFAVSGSTFVTPVTLATQTYNNDVLVAGDSHVDVSGSLAAVMGNLSIGSHTLSVVSSDTSGSNYSLTFSGTTLNDNATFNVANSAGGGKGVLNIGAVAGSGTITKSGAGRLRMTNTGDVTAPSAVNGGVVEIDYTGGSPLASIQSQIIQGYNNGDWAGSGITSAAAAAVAADGANFHKTALGYAESSEVGEPAGSVLIRYTFAGDANLDGQVDTSDFVALANHFGATGADWVQGDSNYDGTVNALDFNAIASNFGATLAPAPSLGALVPEPAMIGTLAFASIAMLGSRRRRN